MTTRLVHGMVKGVGIAEGVALIVVTLSTMLALPLIMAGIEARLELDEKQLRPAPLALVDTTADQPEQARNLAS